MQIPAHATRTQSADGHPLPLFNSHLTILETEVKLHPSLPIRQDSHDPDFGAKAREMGRPDRDAPHSDQGCASRKHSHGTLSVTDPILPEPLSA